MRGKIQAIIRNWTKKFFERRNSKIAGGKRGIQKKLKEADINNARSLVREMRLILDMEKLREEMGRLAGENLDLRKILRERKAAEEDD